MRALIIVNLQNDFMPMGTVPVAEADQIIPIANELLPHFDFVVATQDWHPADHVSFAANHPWRKPGQVIDLNGIPQLLWIMHCVQNSFGALLDPRLDQTAIDRVFQKGMNSGVDSYRGFYDNAHQQATELGDYLKENGVSEVYILGLSLEYDVKHTAIDAIKEGFSTYLIEDACRGVNLEAEDSQKALLEMQQVGVILSNVEAVKTLVKPLS